MDQITRDIASHCGNNPEAVNIARQLLASPTAVHIFDVKDKNGNIIYYRFSNSYILGRFVGHFTDTHIPLSLFLYLCQRNNIDIPQEDRVSVVRVREAITRFREAQQHQQERRRPWSVHDSNQIKEGDIIDISPDNNEMSQLGFTSPVDGGNNDYNDSEMDTTEINNDETQDVNHPVISESMAKLLNASPESSDDSVVEEYMNFINGNGTMPTAQTSKLPPPMKSIPKRTKTAEDDIGYVTKDNDDNDGDNRKQPPADGLYTTPADIHDYSGRNSESYNSLSPLFYDDDQPTNDGDNRKQPPEELNDPILPPPLPNNNSVAAAAGGTIPMADSAPVPQPDNHTTSHQSINSSLGIVPKPSLLDSLKEYSESNSNKKKSSSTKVEEEFNPLPKEVRNKTVNLKAPEVYDSLMRLKMSQRAKRTGQDLSGEVVTNKVTCCLTNLKNGKDMLLADAHLDAYVAVIHQCIILLITGTSIGRRHLWYIVDTYFVHAVNDKHQNAEMTPDEEHDERESDDDDDDYLDLQQFEAEETKNLNESTRKVTRLAYTWFIDALKNICTLIGYTTMHLNIKIGNRAYARGNLVLERKVEVLDLPVFVEGEWTTEKYTRPAMTLDFTQEDGVPLSWDLAKDGLGIDSVKEHFLPTQSSKVNLVQFLEADGPYNLYINSGCAAENGVVCVNTRGIVPFYASYFCVYTEESLQAISLFQNDFNVYGIGIAAGVNGRFVNWEKVDEKATYNSRNKHPINVPEYQLLRKVNYFILFGPNDIETIFKKYPDIKKKNSEWTTKHATRIKTLLDEKKSNFCSKGMAHWNNKMSQRRVDFLKKFEEMELNLQLEALGSDMKLVVGIMNERHKIIVGREEGYEEKMY